MYRIFLLILCNFTTSFLSINLVEAKVKTSTKNENSLAPKVDLRILNEVTEKYRQAKMVKSNLAKTVKAELTGKETKNIGTIAISEGNFRIETVVPEKSLLVFDGKILWNEQSASEEFGGPAQVTKQILSKSGRAQTLFATLLTKDPVTKHFKINKLEIRGDETFYFAESTNSDFNVKDFKIVIENKKKVVSEISFKDDIGNLTTMKFSEVEFKESSDKKLFNYKPPKGAQVTQI